MILKYVIVIVSAILIFAFGTIFGFLLSDYIENSSDEISTITFFHNGSFSGVQPINPGYNLVINFHNDTAVSFVSENYTVGYLITPAGFKNYTNLLD